MKKLIVFVVLMLVLFSGCINTQEKQEEKVLQYPNKGILVEPLPIKPLIAGEEFEITLKVTNVGQSKAENIWVRTPPVLYDLTSNVDVRNYCKDKTLNPPLPDKKKPGDSCEIIISGKILNNLEREYSYSANEINFEIFYNYSTEAKVKLPLYGKGIVNKKRKEGTLPSSEPITENSYAPIKFYVRGKPYLIAGEENVLNVEVSNVGGGELPVDEYGKQKINKVNIYLPQEAGRISENKCIKGISLDKGYCRISIIPKGELDTETYLQLTIKSIYTYKEKAGISLKIVPK